MNETFARRYFSGQNPLGRHLKLEDSRNGWNEIVGVISDVRQRNMDEDIVPIVCRSWYHLAPDSDLSVVVHVSASADLHSIATGQIGIRTALGAHSSTILKMILRETLGLIAVGRGAGTLVALVFYGGVSQMLVGVGLLASYLPARRAANLDPLVALRYE